MSAHQLIGALFSLFPPTLQPCKKLIPGHLQVLTYFLILASRPVSSKPPASSGTIAHLRDRAVMLEDNG